MTEPPHHLSSSPVHRLTNGDKQALLAIARRELVHAVESGAKPGNSLETAPAGGPDWHAGAFVTLRTRGRLRGCIGQMSNSEWPVGGVVAYCARAAAHDDPRFRPVRAEELAETEIEISVLSEEREIEPESIRVGEHGLSVTQGRRRGVLLPHVATEFGWPAMRFLEETCVKAGLDRNAWKNPETKIQAFTAEVFSEREFPPESAASEPGSSYSTST
jgi:AmmeMemoRadiSam system protein A